MVTAHDVHTVTFEKTMRGYSVEQVDELLDRIAAQLEQDEARIAALAKDSETKQAKIEEQAKKLEGYTSYEDALKAALLNAQRMGENVIREAKQKADAIMREANIRADDITHAAESKKTEQEIELERIRGEVAQFKSNVLSLYKAHIESLSTLPDNEPEEPAQEPLAPAVPQPIAEPEAAVPAADTNVQTVPPAFTPISPVEPEMPASPLQQSAPAPTAQPQDDSFWEQDEHELTAPQDAFAPPTPQPLQETEPEASSGTFRGISFSD